MSQEQKMSIVAVILSLSDGPSAEDLTEAQHNNALEWLALQLGIRDRQEIVRVLCQRNPDHLTAAINNAADAYTPMIRQVHQAVNLADTMWDFERFVTDMLKMRNLPDPKDRRNHRTSKITWSCYTDTKAAVTSSSIRWRRTARKCLAGGQTTPMV